MEDFVGGVTKIMEEFNVIEQNYSNDIKDVLKKLDTIVNKCKKRVNDKTPKPDKKKLKRANAAFEKIEDENVSTIQNAVKESYRFPRAAKNKLLQAKQASTNSTRGKVPIIKIEILSDNELNDPKKSINTKIKKENFKKSPQTRRVTRASSRNKNISINSHNGSAESISINESVEVISEEVSVITLSDEDKDTQEQIIKENIIIPEDSVKRITRSFTKSLEKSSNLEKINTSANISGPSIDSNNNDDENNKSRETIYEDALSTTPREPQPKPISMDKTKILENVVDNKTFTSPDHILTNATFVQSVVPEVTVESTFVVNRNENNNSEIKIPAETEKTFILPQTETEKIDIVNPNIPMVSKGDETIQKHIVPVASSNSLKEIRAEVQYPKNTGAIPKQPSKDNKDSGVINKLAGCSVLLKKSNTSSKLYKYPLTTGKPLSAKAPPRIYNNNQERKKAGNSVSHIKSHNQSPNLIQIQQEKEFLRRLEKKRLEIEAKDKQKLARQIAMEQQIKKSLQAIQEIKLQVAQHKQNGELNKMEYNFNMLNSEDSTDDENDRSTKKCELPMWSKPQIRNMKIECQNFMPIKIVDSFFSVAPLNPDLKEIFPEINPKDLKRNSSIFWRTPPRYSQLPKY